MINKEEVANILGMLLGQDIKPDSDISMENCDMWDSMKHIEIITTLEEELGISFPVEDIPKLTSLELILNKIKEIS